MISPKDMRRLFSRIQQQGECWVWEGYRNSKGYGQIWWEGAARYVHRVTYSILVGEIPPKVTLDHTCGNTGCCRPDHLVQETAADNTRLAHRRRVARGVPSTRRPATCLPCQGGVQCGTQEVAVANRHS